MIYLYAICEAAEPGFPDLVGIDGAPVVPVGLGAVTLAISLVPLPPAATLTALRAHQGVLEALMRRHSLLPCRFGTVTPTLADILAAVRWKRPAILSNLQDVAGCVELGLTAGAPRGGSTGTGETGDSGRDYLLRRRHMPPPLDGLDQQLRALSRSHRRLSWAANDDLLRVAYLVPKATVPDFQAAVEAANDTAPLLLASGPWPPYSFVTGDLLGPPPLHAAS